MSIEDVVRNIELMVGFKDESLHEIVRNYFANYEKRQKQKEMIIEEYWDFYLDISNSESLFDILNRTLFRKMFSEKGMTPIDRELSKKVVKIIHGLLMMEEPAAFRKPVPHKGNINTMQLWGSRITNWL